ncbi:MAG TPA: tetratricopeptide repeat protein [Pyrinomonadaceae bacterium]|nr:tetratricopeptide repeat protein [Pyrinomonadaceae bacterium]
MKFFVSRIACLLLLAAALTVIHSTEQRAYGQTQPPAASSTPAEDKKPSSPASPTAQQRQGSERERRAQAYAKMLEGQRYLSEMRRGGSTATLRLAREAFLQAATLDPKLAEAHTALAEIAFYYPPQDFDAATLEGTSATRIDPNNFGAHHILSRLYTIKSGLREGALNRSFAELAVKELKEVVRLDHNNAEGWALLGELHHANGRTQEALDAWTQWSGAPASSDTRFFQYITNRELSPDAAAARLAEALLAKGRTAEALEAIRRAIALNPDNKEYGELLVQAVEAGGIDDKLAIAELQRIVAADPTNMSTVELLARIQARAGSVDAAAATLRAAIGRQPKGDRERQMLRTALAQLYLDALRYTDAVAVYEEQLKDRGIGEAQLTDDEEKLAAARTLQRIVEVYKRAGRISDASATIERMRRLLGKDDPTADAQLVLFLRDQGKKSEALEAVRSARQRFPGQTGFLRLEAQTLADLGRVDEGVALLKTLLKGSSEDFDEYLAISALYLQAAHAQQAVEAARKALELATAGMPDRAEEALIVLSSAQERAGDLKGSEESLRRILARDPNNATALNNLGYFLVERNVRLTEALEMIQRAVRTNPTNSSFLDSLGWAYFKLGRLEEAERHLTEAARRNTTSVAIQEHLGDLYQRRGKTELARAAWQKALTLVVEAGDTARIRAKLSGKAEK